MLEKRRRKRLRHRAFDSLWLILTPMADEASAPPRQPDPRHSEAAHPVALERHLQSELQNAWIESTHDLPERR
jgi:hypothetical protein